MSEAAFFTMLILREYCLQVERVLVVVFNAIILFL